MKEGSEYRAGATTAGPERVAARVVALEQGFAPSFSLDHGVVELMAAEGGAARAQRTIRREPGAPVAEMQPPLRERGLQRQQRRHGVGFAVGIDEAGAQHHIAAALAEDSCAAP